MQVAEPETESEPTNLCIELISTILNDQIPPIQSFKGKWSLIGATLSSLQTQLSDYSIEFPNCSSNPLSLDLLRSLSAALNNAVSLATDCHSPNPSNGKLKTQSDLHSLQATLTRHLNDSQVLFRSGLLHQTDVIHNNANTTTRDSLRSESNNP